jgi:tetratricopeptide (TPR) repeat protein
VFYHPILRDYLFQEWLMGLSKFYAKAVCCVLVALCSTTLYAYDYPVLGEMNSTYQNVFKAIDEGRCDSMSSELQELYEKEGVSGNLYQAVCYFENGSKDKGFDTLAAMVVAQEYDETLYVVQRLEQKGESDPRVLKYKGLAYFNIGAFENALGNFETYIAQTGDSDVRYSIIDIYISLGDNEKAEAELAKIEQKDGNYFFRVGRLKLKEGRIVSALKNLRKVGSGDKEVYSSAKMLIAEICLSSGRYICAEKELRLAADSDYKDLAEDKLAGLDDKKKRFSAFITLGEQYDSNVTSIDEDEVNGVSEEESFRTYIAADLKMNFYPSFSDKISVGMMNYKTWNHSLPSYNMSTHKIYASMKQGYDNFEIILPKVSAAVTYFGGEKYSTVATLETVGILKLDMFRFSIPLSVSKRDYHADTSTGDSDRDGYLYSGEIKMDHTFLKRYRFSLGAGYAVDDAEGALKQKKENSFSTGFSAKLFKKLTASINYNYSKYEYDEWDRDDKYQSVSVKAVYGLTDRIYLNGGYTWSTTDSNEDVYDYVKSVYEAAISYSF